MARWLFFCLLSLYLITGGGKGYSIDGAFGYEMAKTVFLDPEHEYFHRFKTAFARWGALMPLLGQPFVLAGDALSRLAPERDSLRVDSHTFRVEEWPPLGPGGEERFSAPLPEGGGVTAGSIAIISFLSNSLSTGQETVVGHIRLWSGDRVVELPVRAGIETAEWASDRPDVAGQPAHRRARIAGHWIGQPRGNLYYARIDLSQPMLVTRWELAGSSSRAKWHVRAAAFQESESGSWRDALTGERFWSERQTRDFFARLLYSTLNAFTTAATAVLVYATLKLFGYCVPTAALAALGYGVLTMAWPYAKMDFSEPASTCMTMLAVWALFRAFPPAPPAATTSDSAPSIRHTFLLGALASLGLLLAVAGKYTAALGALGVLLQWFLSSGWWRRMRSRHAFAFGATTAVPALLLGSLTVALMFAFTGEVPVPFRNLGDRLFEDWLALPVWIGLRGLVFSPGKSVFLYSPWLLLVVPGAILLLRRHGRHAVLFTVVPLVVIALYGMKLVWHGGAWGPRYLLPIVPLLAVAAAPALEWLLTHGSRARLSLATLAAVSLGVQILGIAKDPETYPAVVREHVVPNLPDMGSHLGGRDYWLARGGAGLERALLDPVSGGKRRGLGYLWGYPDAQLELQLSEARTFDLSLYFVDWDSQDRRQTVTVEDALGQRRLEMDFDFSTGLWATWQVTGGPSQPIRVRLNQRGADTAVLSAAMFDATRGARADLSTLDRDTRGTWTGRYGREGQLLLAWHSFNVDLRRLPTYISGIDATHVGDHPDPRIHVEIAEQELLDTPLLYAAPFSPLLGNAWLLAADAANLIVPSRPEITQGILARPPWTWFGVQTPRIEHPEYGLGLDFWPTLLYTNYASHSSVLIGMWAVLLTLQAAFVLSTSQIVQRLTPLQARWRVLALLLPAILLFNVLQVRA